MKSHTVQFGVQNRKKMTFVMHTFDKYENQGSRDGGCLKMLKYVHLITKAKMIYREFYENILFKNKLCVH